MRGELFPADLLTLEVPLHDRLVRLDDGIDELLPILGCLVGDLRRHLDGRALALPVRRRVRTQMEKVDDACQVVLVSDRDLNGDAALGQLRANLIESGEEVCSLAVEHVHEEKARDAELLAARPETPCLNLDPGDAIEDDERSLDDTQRRERVGLEPGVAGRIDQVDLRVLPLEMAERRRERHLSLVLVLVPVGHCRSLLDRAEAVRGSGLEEQRLDK